MWVLGARDGPLFDTLGPYLLILVFGDPSAGGTVAVHGVRDRQSCEVVVAQLESKIGHEYLFEGICVGSTSVMLEAVPPRSTQE